MRPQHMAGDKDDARYGSGEGDERQRSGRHALDGTPRGNGKYNEELVNAGILLAAEGLHPSVKGKRVAFDGPTRTVMDGPFTETRELLAGFWLWKVKDMAEAVEWLKRCPNPMLGPSEIEIRPVFGRRGPNPSGRARWPRPRRQHEVP